VTVAVDGPASLRLASAVREGGIEIVRATGAAEVDPLDFYDPLQEDAPALPDPQDGLLPEPGQG